MRSLVTGLVMLVDLLKSHDTRVLAAACAVIGILAQEPGNLAILTDYDIVQRLSSLVQTVTLYLQNFLLKINNSPTDSNYFINNYQKLTYNIECELYYYHELYNYLILYNCLNNKIINI